MKIALAASLALMAAPAALAQSTVFAFDLRGDDNLFTFPPNDPTNQTQIGTIGGLNYATYAFDFSTDGQTLHTINHVTTSGSREIGTLDTATGVYTATATITDPAGSINGLSVDPTDETVYIASGTDLYTIDPSTGTTTHIGTFSGLDFFGNPIGTVIDIAIDPSGQMYAHDFTNEGLWSIDKTNAVGTFIEYSGYSANFAQGMDFDPATGILYVAIYTGGGTGVYGTWDTTTGVVTPILDLPDFPNAEVELELAIRPELPPCPADWNGDGNLLTNDFVAYLNDYNAVLGGGSPVYGDPDIAAPTGVLNTADLIAFLNFFNAGCD